MSVAALSPTPPPMSLPEMDWITIRTFYGTSRPARSKATMAIEVGIPISRVIAALHYGKNNDMSLNVVNATSSTKNHPVDGDPMNGLKFSTTPSKRALEGMLFDAKYRRTRERTALAQYKAAAATETDPVKKIVWQSMAKDAQGQVNNLNTNIASLKTLISMTP